MRDPSPIEFDGWSFKLSLDKTSGYVDELVVEIGDIPKQRWPTISRAKRTHNDAGIPIFPFEVNSSALRFSEIEPYVLNLESYLSLFGLEEIELYRLKEEWLPEGDAERSAMQSSFEMLPRKPVEVAEPVTREQLARCIVAARASERETVALAHFRVGQAHFIHQRYMEAIRSLYLCLEHCFVRPGRDHLREFLGARKLTSVVNDLFIAQCHPSLEKIRKRHKALSGSGGSEAFFRFMIGLRGEIQHTNSRRPSRWHPSKQQELEHEAVCIMNVAEAVCCEMVLERMKKVPLATC